MPKQFYIRIFTGSNPVRLNMQKKKKKLNTLEIIYILYCKEILYRYRIDPLCLLFAVYSVNNPLESPFLVGFVYFSAYILTRIPIMFYYRDV